MAQELVEFKDLTEVDFPVHFTEQKFSRSRPLFITKVYGSKIGKEITGFVHLGCLMQSRNGIQEETILTKLRDFAAGEDTTVWIFNNLAVYFGLPISECLPDCVVAQVFVLGKCNKSPFILTLYQDKILATETETKVRRFTVEVAKELTYLLINFCSCKFVILPCTLSYEDFLHNQPSLENQLKEKLQFTISFYNGPAVLDSNTYNALTKAVKVVEGMSSIPYQLRDPRTEDSLVVLDSAWQEAMQQAIVHLMSSCKRWHCTKENEFKVMVAVLEAARRISFSFRVEVRTSNENVVRCLSHVKELTKKEIGIPLNLEAVCIKNDWEYKFFKMQSGIHLSCGDDREGKNFLLSCTVKAAMDETCNNKHEQTTFETMRVD